jgi:GTPase Era involved in 16S rRNA processing
MSHKAGFVNIIGNPNVGKSTLMNAFVGERLSIITSKHKQHVIEFWNCKWKIFK